MTNETIVQAHPLPAQGGGEVSFGTLSGAHRRVQIVVNPNLQIRAQASEWRLYDVGGAGAALIWEGQLGAGQHPERLTPIGGIEAGSTVELRAVGGYPLPTTGAVVASLTGYDDECCGGEGDVLLPPPPVID